MNMRLDNNAISRATEAIQQRQSQEASEAWAAEFATIQGQRALEADLVAALRIIFEDKKLLLLVQELGQFDVISLTQNAEATTLSFEGDNDQLQMYIKSQHFAELTLDDLESPKGNRFVSALIANLNLTGPDLIAAVNKAVVALLP